MRGHRPVLALAVVAALASLVAGSAGAAARAPTHAPDVTVLFQRALDRVRHAQQGTFARAVVFEADGATRGTRCEKDGCTSGRPAAEATDVVAWTFVFQNNTPGTAFPSVTLNYGPWPKGFGRVVGRTAPYLEDVPIHAAPKMTLAGAVARLRRAGYRQRFRNVNLRNPLGPKRTNPYYIFGFDTGPYVAVDTRTGKVTRFK